MSEELLQVENQLKDDLAGFDSSLKGALSWGLPRLNLVQHMRAGPPHTDDKGGVPLSVDDFKDPAQIPIFISFLRDFLLRFKKHIGDANRMEHSSKAFYDSTMARAKSGKEPDEMVKYAKRLRNSQHKHYHSMLKLAHAGMKRIQAAIDILEKAQKGTLPGNWKDSLKELGVILASTRAQLLQLSSRVD
ncbi:unnamed protein product [Vitrella brassicaformis CCMP3155]|uniref:Uncharacterized protein n=1 Tax=Vitrella brassicaformis (strain CCMP3155) TaxID=1169540 RepID=A0A0G4EAL8_VITBC|nr:unnamed protein product [Vitrella brassicaformis CCMP3155]|mmetsp:Transcript_51716/g.129885  ORF Transcript_51716/g.129885 Transcript_51716/m.129885 type:complete len:189 (-) Transcript_51716:115-681(-)|eukprot:CEL92299.1 unnamed protein product [Vitrella brassicaformis CCMP3155]